MCQIAVQIKRRADSAPEKERQHDRQIGKVEARQKSDHSEQLQDDQGNENEKIEFFVLKHVAQGQEAANPGHSTPTRILR